MPIAVGVGVAILAGVLFWWYRRYKWGRQRNARMKTLPLLPGESVLAYPGRWLSQTWLSMRSHRLRPLRKDSDWEIDDDQRRLNRASYHDPYSTPGGWGGEHELGELHTSPHIRETSSTSLLSQIELPRIRRWPTVVEHFIKFKDGIRKSASYKSKYVSPISPDHNFRIDGSAGNTPTANGFKADAASARSLGDTSGSRSTFYPHRVSTVQEEEDENTPGGAPVVVHHNDYDPQRPYSGEVIVISHDGEDFNTDGYSTAGPNSPRTPSTARQVSALLEVHSSTAVHFHIIFSPFPIPNTSFLASFLVADLRGERSSTMLTLPFSSHRAQGPRCTRAHPYRA